MSKEPVYLQGGDSVNYTEKYQLNQWAEEDRILRTDFNADNAKVEAALAGKLGPVEEIRTVQLASASAVTLDLTDVEWSQWTAIGFSLDFLTVGSANTPADLYFEVLAGTTGIDQYCSTQPHSYIGHMSFMPSLFMLLPLRSSGRRVQALYLGAKSGVGFAACTFGEVTGLRMRMDGFFHPSQSIALWGFR